MRRTSNGNIPKLNYNLPFREFLSELNQIDEAIILAVGNKNRPMDVKGKYFPYIPHYNREELVKVLYTNRSAYFGSSKFLDVGCGTGRILALRKYLTGSEVIGIEINPDIVKLGSEIYDVEILTGDAFNLLTKKFMNSIGIIYSYMPIRDFELMRKLEAHIEKVARDGSIRIEMLPQYIQAFNRNNRERTAVFEICQHGGM